MTGGAKALAMLAEPARRRVSLDRLGVVLGLMVLAGLTLPFALLRPSRIAQAEPKAIWESLAPAAGAGMVAVLAGVALLLALSVPVRLRLAASALGLGLLGLGVGAAATALSPAGESYARVSPGAGAWLMLFALGLATGDALVRLRLAPLARVAALAVAAAVTGVFLGSGLWDDLSVMKEYASRAEAFGRELRTHAFLAGASLAAALAVGGPLAVLCRRRPGLRGGLLAGLNIVQTIPSMALFGLLIAPLAWVGANLPGAGALGIAGIGVAPALIALFAYALLPMVSATLGGLDAVPRAVIEAADGMGMTRGQRLLRVELPLALPGILTGARIVLVQNIGLAVIAGLVGGGGLGVFVFQGISQTAPDLVLLGALPTVAMAFAAAVLLDALVEVSGGGRGAGA